MPAAKTHAMIEPLDSILNMIQAQAARAALITSHRNLKLSRPEFVIACAKASRHRLYQRFNFAKEADFIRDCFPGSKWGISTFRDAAQVGRRLFSAAAHIPELRHDPVRREAFVARMLARLYRAVEQKHSWVCELARTGIIGDSTAQTDKNIAELGRIYRDCASRDDFKVCIRKAFGLSSPGRVAGAAKRARRAIKMTLAFEPDDFPAIAAEFLAEALLQGASKSLEEMSPQERGRLMVEIVRRHRAIRGVKPPGDEPEH